MGNHNDWEPDETHRKTDDMLLYDVINRKKRYAVPGDMIQFHRGRYEQWGIYIGDGKVIQVTVRDFGNWFSNAFMGVGRIIETLGEDNRFRENNRRIFSRRARR